MERLSQDQAYLEEKAKDCTMPCANVIAHKRDAVVSGRYSVRLKCEEMIVTVDSVGKKTISKQGPDIQEISMPTDNLGLLEDESNHCGNILVTLEQKGGTDLKDYVTVD